MPRVPFWIFIVIAIVYFTGVRVDTMDVDASQYAEMSREMLMSGNYLHVYDRGMEYLDKPPLLFWLSATSMRLFGINNFGYKLPSILFALWALFATYRLGRSLYNDTIGRMAALVLACCQGLFLMTNDVRCDTILMSCVVTSLWLIQEWAISKKLIYMLGAGVAIALGMMTKGPIALMVPVFCFGSHWVLQRQWRNIFNPTHILVLVVVAVMLIPMSIGLYQQFDMHPEKVIDGRTGVSGLRFFYWSQSFGRITGESPWNNGAKLDFLMLNMLWAFLPWIFLFITALIINVKTLARQKLRLKEGQEWVTTGGFILAYLALGSSAYQLPHYIFVVFPLAAIMTAKLLADMLAAPSRLYRIMQPAHTVISFLLLLAVLLIIAYVFPARPVVIAGWCLCTGFWLWLAFSRHLSAKLFWLPAVAMLIANLFLTNFFYYPLLKYQVGSQAGRYFFNNDIDLKQVLAYRPEDPLNCIQFYAKGRVESSDTTDAIMPGQYVLTSRKGMTSINALPIQYKVLTSGKFYKVSELTLPFLDPEKRVKVTDRYYILKIEKVAGR